MKKVIRHLKTGKAAGMDGIPYEMYKDGGYCMYERLTEL